MLIVIAAFVMAVATYQVPFLVDDTVVVETSTFQHEDAAEASEVIAQLLEQESLSDEEMEMLAQSLDEVAQAQRASQATGDNAASENPERMAYSEVRKSGALWLIPMWALFFLFLPRTKLEYAEALVLPVFFLVTGVILSIEIAIILTLAVACYCLKPRLPSRYFSKAPN